MNYKGKGRNLTTFFLLLVKPHPQAEKAEDEEDDGGWFGIENETAAEVYCRKAIVRKKSSFSVIPVIDGILIKSTPVREVIP